jgi:cytoskeletal protein RodZ
MQNKEILKTAREKIGEMCRTTREDKSLSKYAIEKSHGLRFEQINAIENGDGYTIDTFLTYCSAIGARFYIESE